MKVLVFDTETTGLPVDSNTSAYKLPDNWPHIVSISWAILDSNNDFPIMKSACYVIKPDGWIVPPESTSIHGITHEQAVEFGKPLKDVMMEFLREDYDIVIVHNMYFDKNVIVNAMLWDLKLPFNGFEKEVKCSMLASRTMCNIPFANKNGIKFPKLRELYNHVLGHEPTDNLHTSLYDTLYLCEVIKKSPEIRNRLGITNQTINNESSTNKPEVTETPIAQSS